MRFICPTIGKDHERDFLVTGSLEDFKIIAFSNPEEYEKGIEYLNIDSYEPTEVSVKLFQELSKNDDEFSGIVLNPHEENEFISKKELLEEYSH